MSTEQQYKPGDIQNDHILGEDGVWHAVPQGETPKKNWFARHKVLTGIGGGVLAIILITRMSGGGGDEATTVEDTAAKAVATQEADAPAEDVAEEAPAETGLPGLGDKVRDGEFEFTVNDVKCGIESVGDPDFLGEVAQGQFCRVSLTVENIGKEAQALSASAQKAFDADGREFEANSAASLVDDSNKSSLLYDDINPGNSIEGNIYFDMPKDSEPVALELHDSLFSGGVEVALKK
jgi:hypothetical protein